MKKINTAIIAVLFGVLVVSALFVGGCLNSSSTTQPTTAPTLSLPLQVKGIADAWTLVKDGLLTDLKLGTLTGATYTAKYDPIIVRGDAALVQLQNAANAGSTDLNAYENAVLSAVSDVKTAKTN